MKRLFGFGTLGLICGVGIFVFGGNARKSDEKSDEKILHELSIDSLAQYRDTIVGRFNGVEIDTLICEPILPAYQDELFGKHFFHWRLFTKKGTVKDFQIDSTIGIHFIEEGDLDKNGSDEWGFLNEWTTSTWTTYKLFTCVDGEWKAFADPWSVCWNQIEDGSLKPEDLATRSKKRGTIKGKYCTVINEATEWVVRDTIIPINIKEFENHDYDWGK